MIYYRCKLKKFEVYLKDGKNINQAIIINVRNIERSYLYKIYFFDIRFSYSEFLNSNVEIHNKDGVTLEFIDRIVKEKLSIKPEMEILITGDENEKAVFSLLNSLLINRLVKVGFLDLGYYNELLVSIKNRENEN